jgi:hypothetical protein
MTTYGQIFYSKETFFGGELGDTDISLTAGLISAIYNMTTETQQQKITELELENDRSVFRELPGEKLFIITVDKRMDTDDADDMLDELASKFNEQYGDMVMDGMILNDFEPTVDAVVDERLWYSTAAKGVGIADIIGFLAILASFYFYPWWLLAGQENIIEPLKRSLGAGFVSIIITSLTMLGLTFGPVVILFLIGKISNINLIFRFGWEFIRRPTRGGYAEQIPNWFLVFPLAMAVAIFPIVINGKGVQYALTIQPWITSIETSIVNQNGDTLLWEAVGWFLISYVLSWFIIFPLIIGIVTGDLSWRWFKSSITIIGYSMIIHLPTHIMGGVIWHDIIGINLNDPVEFALATSSLSYIFISRLPINLFLFGYFYYLATGLNQLVTKNKDRFPIALVVGFFALIGIQNLFEYIIFKSGILYPPIL